MYLIYSANLKGTEFTEYFKGNTLEFMMHQRFAQKIVLVIIL